jgi:hypothetical protein
LQQRAKRAAALHLLYRFQKPKNLRLVLHVRSAGQRQHCAIVVIIVDLATLQTEKSFRRTGYLSLDWGQQ